MDNYVSFSDLIRPVGSVYFSYLGWNFNPANLFGGTWINSGTVKVGAEAFNVWHRTA